LALSRAESFRPSGGARIKPTVNSRFSSPRVRSNRISTRLPAFPTISRRTSARGSPPTETPSTATSTSPAKILPLFSAAPPAWHPRTRNGARSVIRSPTPHESGPDAIDSSLSPLCALFPSQSSSPTAPALALAADSLASRRASSRFSVLSVSSSLSRSSWSSAALLGDNLLSCSAFCSRRTSLLLACFFDSSFRDFKFSRRSFSSACRAATALHPSCPCSCSASSPATPVKVIGAASRFRATS